MKKKLRAKIRVAIINASIAGLLVFFGSFTNGIVSIQGICAAVAACVIIFLTKMRDSINTLNKELFVFV